MDDLKKEVDLVSKQIKKEACNYPRHLSAAGRHYDPFKTLPLTFSPNSIHNERNLGGAEEPS